MQANLSLSPCILWTGAPNNGGYGPHRRLWLAKYGAIPKGLDLDHLCRTRNCINLEHLQLVPHVENVRRGLRGRLVTHCPNGHPYDDANTVLHHGRRECLTCRREKDRGRRDAEFWRNYRASHPKPPPPPRPLRYCEIGGCERVHYGRGLCSMHYQRAVKAEAK